MQLQEKKSRVGQFHRPRMSRPFNKEEIEQLGKTSDRDLAERIGCSEQKIRLMRYRLNIPKFGKWPPLDYSFISSQYDQKK